MIDRFSPEYANSHLGASQISTAIGVSPYARPIELFEEYVGLRGRMTGNDATELGHALEDGVVRIAANRLNVSAKASPTLEHPRIPWLCATPDRVLSDWSLLQVKTTGLTSYQHVEARDRWGDDGSDEVPLHVVAQVQTELLVARAQPSNTLPMICHVAALIAGRGVVIYPIPFDDEIARAIVTKASKFWKCVQEKTPPPIDGSDAFTDYLKKRFPDHRPDRWVEGNVADELVHTLRQSQEQYDLAEVALKTAKQQCMDTIKDAQGLRGSWGSLPWTGRNGKKGLRLELLRNELVAAGVDADALIERSTQAGQPYRQFGPIHLRKVKP